MELYSSPNAPAFLDMDAAATVLAVAVLLGDVLSLVMQTVGISSASAAVIPMAEPTHAWTRAVTAMAPAASAQPRAALDAVPGGWCVAAVLAAFILGVAVGWAALRWASSLSRSRSGAAMAAPAREHARARTRARAHAATQTSLAPDRERALARAHADVAALIPSPSSSPSAPPPPSSSSSASPMRAAATAVKMCSCSDPRPCVVRHATRSPNIGRPYYACHIPWGTQRGCGFCG